MRAEGSAAPPFLDTHGPLSILPAVPPVGDAAVFVARLGIDAGSGSNDNHPSRFDGRPAGPGACVFPARNHGPNEVPGLEPEMAFLPRQVPDGKPVFVRPAALPVAAALGRPDMDVHGQRGEGFRGAGADAQGVVIVLLGKRVRNPLHLGPCAGPAFGREPRGLQLVVEPPAGGVHPPSGTSEGRRRRILQRGFHLALDPL